MRSCLKQPGKDSILTVLLWVRVVCRVGVVWVYVVLRCVVLCCVVLCSVVLCCAVLCSVALCSVVLCCVVLCCVVFSANGITAAPSPSVFPSATRHQTRAPGAQATRRRCGRRSTPFQTCDSVCRVVSVLSDCLSVLSVCLSVCPSIYHISVYLPLSGLSIITLSALSISVCLVYLS